MEKAHVVSSVRSGDGRVFVMVEVPNSLNGSGKNDPAMLKEQEYFKPAQKGIPDVVKTALITGAPPAEFLEKKLPRLMWRLNQPSADAPHDPNQKTFEIWSDDHSERYAYCVLSTPPNTRLYGYEAVIDFHEAHPKGLGLGTFLYQTLVEPYVRSLHYKAITLTPLDSAIEFWTKMGFKLSLIHI